MSKLEVDKIDPQSGTDLELGSSGDTITIPSGATLDASNATTTLPANVVTTDGTQTLTNKSINASQLTGTITPSDGTVTSAKIGANEVTGAKLNNDVVSSQTELASEPADTDEFLVSDAGTLKRIDYSLIKGGGITVADQWRLTADKANVDTNFTAFDSNLERVDTGGQGTIGSAMSFDTGTGNFTFPANGIYLVKAEVSYQKDANRRYTGVGIKVTTNNSNYTMVAEGYETINPVDGNNSYSYVSASSLIDVSNFNNVKVRFGGIAPSAITAMGNTTINLTCFTFIRLGDT